MRAKRHRSGRAFTILELMVVVGIIGLLAAAVVPALLPQAEKTKETLVRKDFSTLGHTLDVYRLHMGSYPRELRHLWERPPTGRGWQGPYLKPEDSPPRDAWGNDYLYESSGSGYELKSWGPDGAPGADDLSSKDPRPRD